MDNFVEVALWLIGITHGHSVTRCLTPKTLSGEGGAVSSGLGPSRGPGKHLWPTLVAGSSMAGCALPAVG